MAVKTVWVTHCHPLVFHLFHESNPSTGVEGACLKFVYTNLDVILFPQSCSEFGLFIIFFCQRRCWNPFFYQRRFFFNKRTRKTTSTVSHCIPPQTQTAAYFVLLVPQPNREVPKTVLARRIVACLDVRSNDAGDLVVTKGDQYDVREKEGLPPACAIAWVLWSSTRKNFSI